MNSSTVLISRQKLYDIIKSSGCETIDEKFNLIKIEIEKRLKNCEQNDLKKKLSYFKSEYKSRWEKAHRVEERFIIENKNWLNASIKFVSLNNQNNRGRPVVAFEMSSERNKRKITQELRNNTSVNVLGHATQMSLRASGQVEAAKLLKEITTSTPTRASRYRKVFKKQSEQAPKKLSGEDALAVIVDAKLSRHQYNIIRMSAPDKFPSYKVVQESKKQCYPKPENIQVTSTSAEVSLQALLDHTVERLFLVQKPVIVLLQENELDKFILYSKWGFDGSSGHSSYKQAFCNPEASDSAVFITSIVPLRLVNGDQIIWQNPRPASTRYCRPIKIEFIKESTDTSIAEKEKLQSQINSIVTFDNKSFIVTHNLILAMVDGKICNALTDTTSTLKCFLCGATSKQFNLIDEMVKREVKTDNLSFGISVLHGWIRFFECLLHLSYKLPLKKWQARGDVEKKIVSENKLRIQKEFKDKLGLLVDKPKPGFGNSNDGNTARRFFQNSKISAEITKLDVEIIEKIHIIMIVVASGHEIKINEFREYTYKTAKYFVEKYPWYNMSPTMHKFFIHGPEIIESALLPIGLLTEEAQEARNKDFKRYREHNSRKCCREKTNLDILNLFLLSSDPVISSKRKLMKKKTQSMPIEALALLKSPDVRVSLQYAKDSDDDDDDNDDDDDDDDDNDNDDDYDEDNDTNEDNEDNKHDQF